ncbi:MAG: flagellar biosynthesis anti-sigma factor FlgM [Desulfobacterales bacterium]|jgi:negative regulator of flagellin synthesis FlgM
MKISDPHTTPKIVKITAKDAVEKPSESASAARNDDRVTLSPKARELLEAQRILAATPDIREEKVAAIKARIADGRYRIDSERVAARMIQEALSDKK